MIKRFIATLALASGTFSPAFAADFSQCPQFFADGVPPSVPALQARGPRALCFDAFAVMYSGTSKTPLYVAERLNRARLIDAKDEERTNRFYEEARLPSADRSHLNDYKGSGFDRGHLQHPA